MKTFASLLLLLPIGCSTTASSEGAPQVVRGESYMSAILPSEAATSMLKPGERAFTPSREVVEHIEMRLHYMLNAALRDPQAYSDHEMDYDGIQWTRERVLEILGRLPRYYRQYVGFVTADGSREIFVNFFTAFEEQEPLLGFDDDWTEELIFVNDGGAHYWRVMFDPAADRFSNLLINGES